MSMTGWKTGLAACLLMGLAGCGGCSDPGGLPTTTETAKDASKQPNPDKTDTPEDGTLQMAIQREPFPNKNHPEFKEEVTQYLLSNGRGMQVSLINYGAIVTAVNVPDKNGKVENVTLGFDSLDGYLDGHPYFGATVGRYANRIAGGKFKLNDKEYTLAANNGPNHLHGGEKGFDKRIWHANEMLSADEGIVGVKFTYHSPDGEEGYPGDLTVSVTYSLTKDNELKMEYEAKAMGDTVLNLTNHCYWNLATPAHGAVLDHELKLNCDRYLPVDANLIPTGELKSVEGTPMDFTKAQTIGSRIQEVKGDNPQGGYDHCYVINHPEGEDRKLALAATVTDPHSGRVMTIHTDQPGIQFYTGNFLEKEKDGQHGQHYAFCLETQHFPDSPNQPGFPSTTLKQGQVFRSTTVHTFSVQK